MKVFPAATQIWAISLIPVFSCQLCCIPGALTLLVWRCCILCYNIFSLQVQESSHFVTKIHTESEGLGIQSFLTLILLKRAIQSPGPPFITGLCELWCLDKKLLMCCPFSRLNISVLTDSFTHSLVWIFIRRTDVSFGKSQKESVTQKLGFLPKQLHSNYKQQSRCQAFILPFAAHWIHSLQIPKVGFRFKVRSANKQIFTDLLWWSFLLSNNC